MRNITEEIQRTGGNKKFIPESRLNILENIQITVEIKTPKTDDKVYRNVYHIESVFNTSVTDQIIDGILKNAFKQSEFMALLKEYHSA